ncbi:MAG: tetratricopeptide repeat protein, partial [Cyanobacteria bacterium]|nr:tetratricopeptide repeat protein [Cyanobacteriota bacterium]
LDATNPEPWVDATHIKFADSDLSSPDAPVALSEQVIGMMGQLKIEVLESHNKATTEISLGMGNIAIPTPIKPVDIEAIDIKGKSRAAIKQFRTVSPQEVARENTLEGYLDQGIQALYQDQYTQAMALFQKAANEAKTPMAQFALGERFYGLELYRLSQNAFQKASQSDSTLAPLAQSWIQEFFPQESLSSRQEEAYLKGVSSLLNSQNGDSTPMNAIIQESPRFYPALLHQAQELAQSGKIKEALGVYQQIQQVAPQDPRGLQGMGNCYLGLKKFTQATQAFQQAIVVAKALKSPPGKNLLKDLYTQQVVAQGRLACAKNPGSISAWLSIGKGLMEQRRPFEALSAFKKAVALSPPRYPSPEALAYQIKIYLGNNDWEGAQSYYQRLKGHAGNVPFAYTALGYYEMRMRQYPLAIQHLKEAIRLNPQSAQSYGHLAEVYLRLKEPRNAQKVLEQGLLASQGKPSSQSSLTQGDIPEAFFPVAYDLAKLMYQSSPSKAEKLLLKLVTQDPLNGKACQLLGQIALNSNDLTQAKTVLSKAFVLEPTDPSILATVGDLYRRLQDTHEAIYYFEKALKLAPTSPEASRSLGLLIEEQGINREKPRLYLEITDDEKDYLTALTLKVQRYLVNQNEQALPENGSGAGSEKTTVYDRKLAAYEQLGASYDALLPQYEFLKRISPPERFVTLHAATLKTFYASLLSLNAGEMLLSTADLKLQEKKK